MGGNLQHIIIEDGIVKAHFWAADAFFSPIERSSPAYLRLIFFQVGFNRNPQSSACDI